MIRFITVPEDNGFEFEFIGDYNRYFKADMYPIAASHTVYDYFMNTEGGIYAFYGNIGAKWGESFEGFILNIIRGTTREFENIKAQHKEQI